jgi:hypothetical protein
VGRDTAALPAGISSRMREQFLRHCQGQLLQKSSCSTNGQPPAAAVAVNGVDNACRAGSAGWVAPPAAAVQTASPGLASTRAPCSSSSSSRCPGFPQLPPHLHRWQSLSGCAQANIVCEIMQRQLAPLQLVEQAQCAAPADVSPSQPPCGRLYGTAAALAQLAGAAAQQNPGALIVSEVFSIYSQGCTLHSDNSNRSQQGNPIGTVGGTAWGGGWTWGWGTQEAAGAAAAPGGGQGGAREEEAASSRQQQVAPYSSSSCQWHQAGGRSVRVAVLLVAAALRG